MPIRLPFYEQMVRASGPMGAPRAQAVQQVDFVGEAVRGLVSEVQQVGERYAQARRDVELTDRLGKATAELTELELTFSRDQDWKTSPDRFRAAADQVRDKYLDGVSDASVRQAFTKQFQTLSLSKYVNVRKDAFGMERQQGAASLDAAVDVFAKSAATARNPGERALIDNQMRLAISTAQTAGYVDPAKAGDMERLYLRKVDEATVVRDMTADPSKAALYLADPTYAPNLDPVQRERWIDQGYRRAESQRKEAEAAEAKRARERGDEVTRDVWGRLADRTLTREFLDQNRSFMSPAEYRQALDALKKSSEGASAEDNRQAFAEVQSLLYSDPAAARRAAFAYHKQGKLKDSTLSQILSSSRDLERQDGPKSPYERSRAYLTQALEPSPTTQDPAPRARQAVAIREFDDWFRAGKRSDAEVEAKADEILGRLSMINMADLARRTGIGARPTPKDTLESIRAEAQKIQADLEAKRITQAEFDRKMTNLNNLRKAAEKAGSGGK